MEFTHPGFLWALFALLTPIIIHYLMRLRSRRVEWGASWVLERALARLGRRPDWEQIALLALRALVCVVLVLAFARPVARDADAVASGTGIHRVIVLDATHSMGARNDGKSRWEQGVAMVRDLATTWGRGERWSLFVIDRDPRWIVRDARIGDGPGPAALIAPLAPQETATPLAQALSAVFAAVADEQAEVYLVTDDQTGAWHQADAIARPDPERVRAVWIRPPLTDPGNRSVTALRPAGERALVGHPLRVTASIRNHAAQAVEGLEVEFLLDGVRMGSQRIAIQAGQEAVVTHDLVPDRPGVQVVGVRLPADALAEDNLAVAAVAVVDRLRVLVLRDAEGRETLDSAWEFLNLAARVLTQRSATGAALWSGAPFTVQLHTGAVAEAPLTATDVVVIDGARSLAEGDGTRLAAWVAAGGGLLLCADEAIVVPQWQDELGRHGLLPATLGPVQSVALGDSAAPTIARPASDAGELSGFSDTDDGDLARLRVHARRMLTPADDTRTLLRFSDGEPFALLQRGNLGTTVLLAAGLHGRSNNLMVREAFYPLLVRLFSAAAGGAEHPRTIAPDAPLLLRLETTAGLRAATVSQGSGATLSLTIEATGAVSRAVLADGLPRSGIAEILLLRDDGAERTAIAVQGDYADSDLTPLSDDARQQLANRLSLTLSSDPAHLATVVAAWRGAREHHHWVIIALLLCLTGELLLLRRFG